MFLVQSLDGKIQIFEQSANAFSRQLLDCLIPGENMYMYVCMHVCMHVCISGLEHILVTAT